MYTFNIEEIDQISNVGGRLFRGHEIAMEKIGDARSANVDYANVAELICKNTHRRLFLS